MAPEYVALAAAEPSVRFLAVNCDDVADLAAARAIRGLPTLQIFFRGSLLCSFMGADMNRLRVEMARAVRDARDVLSAEAAAEADCDDNGDVAVVSVSGSATIEAAAPTSPDDDTNDDAELAAALRLSEAP